MDSLLRHIHEDGICKVHATIVVGAGSGNQLADLRNFDCEKLVLAEAHPRQAEELGRRLRQGHGEHLLALAVTANDQAVASLKKYNNIAFSSLSDSAGLLEYYPNLRQEETFEVPAKSLEKVLSECDLDRHNNNLLLLSAPGQAGHLIKGTPANELQIFTWLLIECNAEPLYEGEANSQEVINYLTGLGFEQVCSDNQALYPQIRMLFKRNPLAVERLSLLADMVALQSELQKSKEKIDEQQVETEKIKLTLAQRVEDVEQYVIKLDGLERNNSFLTSSVVALEDRNKTIAAELDEQSLLAAKQQGELETLRKINFELVDVRDALKTKLSALTKSYEDLREVANSRLSEIARLEKDTSDAQLSLKALEDLRDDLVRSRDEESKLAADMKRQFELANEKNSELNRALSAVSNQVEELNKANHEQAVHVTNLQAQIVTLKDDNSKLALDGDKLRGEKSSLTETLNEHITLVGEYKVQVQSLCKIETELNLAHEELLKEKFDLIKAYDELQLSATTREEQLADIQAKHDNNNKALAEQKEIADKNREKIKCLEVEAANTHRNQQLLRDELLRSEAQIELITDLLLREPGL
ncbi:TPA: hypothetical protein ACNV18_000599 [Pseudomonas putida]